MSSSSDSEQKRLHGWKEIAQYLAVQPRTAQRWAKNLGLPVRYLKTEKSAKPWAEAAELDQWNRNRDAFETAAPGPSRTERRSRRVAAVILVAVAGTAVVIGLVNARSRALPAEPAAPSPPVRRYLHSLTGDRIVPTIKVTQPPGEMAVVGGGRSLAYVPNWDPIKGFYLVDLVSGGEQFVELPFKAYSLIRGQNENIIYLGSSVDGIARVLLPSMDVQAKTTGGPVRSMAISPDGRRVFLAMDHLGLGVLDATSDVVRRIDSDCCPWFLTVDAANNRLLVSYQNGGPGGRGGHDALRAFDLTSERPIELKYDWPLVGGPVIVSAALDRAVIDGWDACLNTKYDQIGCPETGTGVYHVFQPSNLRHPSKAVAVERTSSPILLLDDRRVLVAGRLTAVFDLARGLFTERLPVLAASGTRAVALPDGRIALGLAAPPGLKIIEGEDPKCSPHPASAVHAFTADGIWHDVIGNLRASGTSGCTFGTGVRGQAFHLAEGCEISVSSNTMNPFPNVHTSLALHFKAAAHDISLVRTSRGVSAALSLLDGRLAFSVTTVAGEIVTLASPREIPLNAWHHAAVVVQPARVLLYLDGEVAAATASDLFMRDPTTVPPAVRVGGGNEQAWIDELFVYGDSLTPEEVRNIARLSRCPAATPAR